MKRFLFIQEHELLRIHRWLDAPPAIVANVPEWHEGTCSWILQHETFRQWEQNPGGGCLWIHGKPGKKHSFLGAKTRTNLRHYI